MHEPRAYAGGSVDSKAKVLPAPQKPPIEVTPPNEVAPPKDKTEQTVDSIYRIVDQKQAFFDATNDAIAERLQVIAQCQNNIDALATGVNSEGLDNLGQHIAQTRPLISHLKQVIAANRHKVAILALEADNLDRRIIQLHMHATYELRPDPSRLLNLRKQLDHKVNQALCAIDADDPLIGKELDRVGAIRASMEQRILTEEGNLLNRAADQAVAAGTWEDREYDRYLDHEGVDLPKQLRNELLDGAN
jgi:hypothetical protein